MKKAIILLLAACIAGSLCFAACDDGKDPVGGGDDQNQDQGDQTQEKDPYEALNKMTARENYSGVEVTVTDTFAEGVFLTSVYTVTFDGDGITVRYEAERFAEIPSLGALPGSEKRTLHGTAQIKDGKVTVSDGEDAGITAPAQNGGFEFKKEYFTNAELTDMYLKADVVNGEAFMGVKDSNNMHVEATFLDAFYDISVTYTAAGGDTVEILYTFIY